MSVHVTLTGPAGSGVEQMADQQHCVDEEPSNQKQVAALEPCRFSSSCKLLSAPWTTSLAVSLLEDHNDDFIQFVSQSKFTHECQPVRNF